jgi:hypothetical protein
MEKAVKAKLAKAVVPAIDAMYQAIRCVKAFSNSFVFIVVIYPYTQLSSGNRD